MQQVYGIENAGLRFRVIRFDVEIILVNRRKRIVNLRLLA